MLYNCIALHYIAFVCVAEVEEGKKFPMYSTFLLAEKTKAEEKQEKQKKGQEGKRQ